MFMKQHATISGIMASLSPIKASQYFDGNSQMGKPSLVQLALIRKSNKSGNLFATIRYLLHYGSALYSKINSRTA